MIQVSRHEREQAYCIHCTELVDGQCLHLARMVPDIDVHRMRGICGLYAALALATDIMLMRALLQDPSGPAIAALDDGGEVSK